jgi:hypothetical protein
MTNSEVVNAALLFTIQLKSASISHLWCKNRILSALCGATVVLPALCGASLLRFSVEMLPASLNKWAKILQRDIENIRIHFFVGNPPCIWTPLQGKIEKCVDLFFKIWNVVIRCNHLFKTRP